jgi:glycosyltransferase involved in cell wall biosynthesis
MLSSKTNPVKHILIVARWPLGGIRTYMRYVFRHFPRNYSLTLLAASTQEDTALTKDAEEYGARLLLIQDASTKWLVAAVFHELRTRQYDVILSQGFISAVVASMANILFRVPHVLTIHGIVEPKYLTGRFGNLKQFILGRMLAGITVLHAVSNDILNHLYEQFPKLKSNGPRAIVIPNGIELKEFDKPPANPIELRAHLGIDDPVFLFGFFGRFMQQKGFDLLIQAVDMLRKQGCNSTFAVVAVGSDDYLEAYQKTISESNMDSYFYFLPFQPEIHHLFPQVDAVVMPSRWEAGSLLAMEALCSGRPLIASDCLGLRETVRNTPSVLFPSEDVAALARALESCMIEPYTEKYINYRSVARERFDVTKSALQLLQVIETIG